jgi:hypothetical protein
MLGAGVIRPSVSDWHRLRSLFGSDVGLCGGVWTKDVFPLPLVDDCLDTLAGNVWYSKLDANSTYWQMKIIPENCSKNGLWVM